MLLDIWRVSKCFFDKTLLARRTWLGWAYLTKKVPSLAVRDHAHRHRLVQILYWTQENGLLDR